MSQRDDLKERIATLLDGSLGLNIFGQVTLTFGSKRIVLFVKNAWGAGLRMSLGYAFVFIVVPWLLSLILPVPTPNFSLFLLQVYGSLWSGWSTTSTRLTSSAISTIIGKNIVPQLSDEVAAKIDRELATGFDQRWLLSVSWAIGTG